jgi:putative Holliday junction resolvase
MGLDYGTRRVGVALSDPLHITAQGYAVIDVRREDLIARIASIAREQDVERIVVGLPVSLSGFEGASAVAARELAEAVAAATELPVEVSDERFSTRTAESALVQANVRRRRRRQVVDKVAAAVMLQHYLDRT